MKKKGKKEIQEGEICVEKEERRVTYRGFDLTEGSGDLDRLLANAANQLLLRNELLLFVGLDAKVASPSKDETISVLRPSKNGEEGNEWGNEEERG